MQPGRGEEETEIVGGGGEGSHRNSFRYLVLVISAADEEWPAVVGNLSRERAVWRSMTRILIREVAAPRVSGFFFKSMVQVMLIFGAETWVVTPRIGKALGVFQAQVERRLTGWLPWRTPDRK